MWQIRAFLSLPSIERWAFVRAFCIVVTIRLALWIIAFHKLYRLLEHPMPDKPGYLTPERIAWSVEVAGRYVPVATCLTQALATRWLLHRQGDDSELRIGVAKKPGGTLEAHAWLEHDGRVVIGDLDDLDRYTLLPSFERGLL